MVELRNGKQVGALQAAGPSDGSRKRKATEPPPERQRAPSTPFVETWEPDSPSCQLFADMYRVLNPIVRPSVTPPLQLLFGLRKVTSAQPTSILPSIEASSSAGPSSAHASFNAVPPSHPLITFSPEVSPSPEWPLPRRRSPTPSPPRAAFSDYRVSPPRAPTPPEKREKEIANWLEKKMKAYVKEKGDFADLESRKKVEKIFRTTAEMRRVNLPHPTSEQKEQVKKWEKEHKEHKAEMREYSQHQSMLRERRKGRKHPMTEEDYRIQNETNDIRAVDFAYAYTTRREMRSSSGGVELGRRIVPLQPAPVEPRVNFGNNRWMKVWQRLNLDGSRWGTMSLASRGGSRAIEWGNE